MSISNLLKMWICIVGLLPFLVSLSTGSELKRHIILETDCECGVKNHDATTILSRGTFSENHAWPWMVSIVNLTILDDPIAYCGATLINDRYILTAAHCIPDMLDTGIDNFKIYLGTNYINGSDYKAVGIRTILSHPKFDYETAENDVCLIKLSEPVKFTKEIKPICLKQNGAPFVGYSTYMTGWGSFNLSEPTEAALKEAVAVVVSNEVCAKNYSTVEIPVTETMICASLQFPEDDPCKGDSGGPLAVKDESTNVYSQIGIISHGQGCTVLEYPAIFSRVSSFIDWIKASTADAVYCTGTFSS